ncbi:MAG: hypothetical protein GX336_05470 [Halanaerobiaceae bacterium]|nr:hypothetical protein [Halanaerobiaceae bacterium]
MNIDGFLQTLSIALRGLGGIFIVMGIIYLSIKLVNIFFADNGNNNK